MGLWVVIGSVCVHAAEVVGKIIKGRLHSFLSTEKFKKNKYHGNLVNCYDADMELFTLMVFKPVYTEKDINQAEWQ